MLEFEESIEMIWFLSLWGFFLHIQKVIPLKLSALFKITHNRALNPKQEHKFSAPPIFLLILDTFKRNKVLTTFIQKIQIASNINIPNYVCSCLSIDF